ncbi:hypothetical protein [Nocardia brevicatena]|uniref:hypothetical protein n=1 Tax=Nocardia brevicatena TaxID=37327 RepID=UPI0012F7DBE1|nr:hypothetical protein [Nocardia brevicatena]
MNTDDNEAAGLFLASSAVLASRWIPLRRPCRGMTWGDSSGFRYYAISGAVPAVRITPIRIRAHEGTTAASRRFAAPSGHPQADGSMIDTAIREAAEEVGMTIAPEERRSAALCTTCRPPAGWCCLRSVDGRGVKYVDHITGISSQIIEMIVFRMSRRSAAFITDSWLGTVVRPSSSSGIRRRRTISTVRCAAAVTASNYYFDRDGFSSR